MLLGEALCSRGAAGTAGVALRAQGRVLQAQLPLLTSGLCSGELQPELLSAGLVLVQLYSSSDVQREVN